MDEVVGQLNYPGDIRAGYHPQVLDTPRYGPVQPAVVEYDEERDVTTVGFISLRALLGLQA